MSAYDIHTCNATHSTSTITKATVAISGVILLLVKTKARGCLFAMKLILNRIRELISLHSTFIALFVYRVFRFANSGARATWILLQHKFLVQTVMSETEPIHFYTHIRPKKIGEREEKRIN